MDSRLLACASLVKGGRAADVGTDHGHLPVYLIEQGICQTAAACDINEMPLASARANIEKAGMTDRIQCFLSDGLDSVPDEGITDVIIAGMGGELIADIIRRTSWIKERKVNLILQPMTKWDSLRRFLYDSCFSVEREIPCREGRFVYSVMQAVYSGKKPDHPCDLRYLYCGLVTGETEEGAAYLRRQAQRLGTAGRGMLRDPQRRKLGEEYIHTAEKLLKD